MPVLSIVNHNSCSYLIITIIPILIMIVGVWWILLSNLLSLLLWAISTHSLLLIISCTNAPPVVPPLEGCAAPLHTTIPRNYIVFRRSITSPNQRLWQTLHHQAIPPILSLPTCHLECWTGPQSLCRFDVAQGFNWFGSWKDVKRASF